MASNFTARQQSGWKVVSLTPDVCKTPMGSSTPPVPYPVIADLGDATQVAGAVNANGHPLVTFDMSLVPKTKGDSAGTEKGVKSGTVEGKCYPKTHTKSVRAEGKYLVRHDDIFWMNGK